MSARFLIEFSIENLLNDPNTSQTNKNIGKFILSEMEHGAVFVEKESINDYVEFIKNNDDSGYYFGISDEGIKKELIATSYLIRFCEYEYYWFPSNNTFSPIHKIKSIDFY